MDIKINESEWNGVSDEDREKIKQIISHSFKEDHSIVPDAGTPTSVQRSSNGVAVADLLSNPFCNAACGVAEASAVAACSALSGGVAIAACIAAAHAAGDFCRSRC